MQVLSGDFFRIFCPGAIWLPSAATCNSGIHRLPSFLCSGLPLHLSGLHFVTLQGLRCPGLRWTSLPWYSVTLITIRLSFRSSSKQTLPEDGQRLFLFLAALHSLPGPGIMSATVMGPAPSFLLRKFFAGSSPGDITGFYPTFGKTNAKEYFVMCLADSNDRIKRHYVIFLPASCARNREPRPCFCHSLAKIGKNKQANPGRKKFRIGKDSEFEALEVRGNVFKKIRKSFRFKRKIDFSQGVKDNFSFYTPLRFLPVSPGCHIFCWLNPGKKSAIPQKSGLRWKFWALYGDLWFDVF